MSITTITHAGKVIYFNDWRKLKTPEEFNKEIEISNKKTQELQSEGKSDILILTDVTGSFMYGDTLSKLKESGKLAKSITKKSAVVGLSLAKKVILNGVNIFASSEIKAFNTVDEAKQWLVS